MKGDKLPDEHHVARCVPWSRLVKRDGDGDVIGVFPAAFTLRKDEEYLSVTWIEHFDGNICDRVSEAVRATRRSIKVGGKARFVVGNVAAIHATCAKCEVKVRIVHEPEEVNGGHAAIRRMPRENHALPELLATEAFTMFIDNAAVS
jgi:hypothetical protein